jgi:hypothetical protein
MSYIVIQMSFQTIYSINYDITIGYNEENSIELTTVWVNLRYHGLVSH